MNAIWIHAVYAVTVHKLCFIRLCSSLLVSDAFRLIYRLLLIKRWFWTHGSNALRVSRIAVWTPGLRRNMYPARRWRTRAADSQTCLSIMSRRALTLKWGAGWILMFSFINNTWAQGKRFRSCSGPWDSALRRQWCVRFMERIQKEC